MWPKVEADLLELTSVIRILTYRDIMRNLLNVRGLGILFPKIQYIVVIDRF